MKLLVYDGTGLIQISKRIERGQFMSLTDLLGRSEITHDELKLIMHGSIIRRPVVDRSMTGDKIFSTQREPVAMPSGISQISY